MSYTFSTADFLKFLDIMNFCTFTLIFIFGWTLPLHTSPALGLCHFCAFSLMEFYYLHIWT